MSNLIFFSIRRVPCGTDPWASPCSRSRSPARPTARARDERGPPCPPGGVLFLEFSRKKGSAGWQGLSRLVALGSCLSAADGVEREGRERRILWGGRLPLVPAAGRGRGGKVHPWKNAPESHTAVVPYKGRWYSRCWTRQVLLHRGLCYRTRVVGRVTVGRDNRCCTGVVLPHKSCWYSQSLLAA